MKPGKGVTGIAVRVVEPGGGGAEGLLTFLVQIDLIRVRGPVERATVFGTVPTEFPDLVRAA